MHLREVGLVRNPFVVPIFVSILVDFTIFVFDRRPCLPASGGIFVGFRPCLLAREHISATSTRIETRIETRMRDRRRSLQRRAGSDNDQDNDGRRSQPTGAKNSYLRDLLRSYISIENTLACRGQKTYNLVFKLWKMSEFTLLTGILQWLHQQLKKRNR